jgi:hypothetical protein
MGNTNGMDKCAKDLATEGMNRWVKRSLGRMRRARPALGGSTTWVGGRMKKIWG